MCLHRILQALALSTAAIPLAIAEAPAVERDWVRHRAAPSVERAPSIPIEHPAPALAVEKLGARRWFEPLPAVEIRLAGGGVFRSVEAGYRVLVLDFWASWCKPCLLELPALRELYDTEKERGLEAVIVNVGESADVIERFAAANRLTMPIGFYDERLDALLSAKTLPTVIVADDRGRIRARFDGYTDGIEKKIAGVARSLLGETAETLTEVASVDQGQGLFEVAWMRPAPGNIEGLEVARFAGAAPSIVVAAGRELATYDALGVITASWPAPAGWGLLRAGDFDGDGQEELLTFRRGATRVSRTGPAVTAVGFDAPEPLFDLEVLKTPPRGAGDGETAELWLATVGKLYRSPADGSAPKPIEGLGTVLDVAALDGGRVVVLGSEGLCFIEPNRASDSSSSCTPSEGAMAIEGLGDRGWLEVSAGVAAVAAGSFTREGAFEIAVATRAGRIVVLDPASGETAWRASWPGAAHLEAVDFDGDGLDELAVGHGNRLSVLQRRAGE